MVRLAERGLGIKQVPQEGTASLAVSFSCPMNTSSWCFVMERLDAQCSTVSFSLASLSLGNLSSLDMVSTSKPRKVREVAGPSSLEGSTGRPSLADSRAAVSSMREQVK